MVSVVPVDLRLALIDSRPLVRAALQNLLETRPAPQSSTGFVVRPFTTPGDFLDYCQSAAQEVDVVLFSVGAAPTHDPFVRDGVCHLRQHAPGFPLALVCDHMAACHGLDAIRLGVDGYIPTTLTPAVATQAIRLVHAGGTFLPAELLMGGMEGENREVNLPAMSLAVFTTRERAVLNLMWQGKSNKVIAHHLSVSDSTVKVYVRQIMKKLGASNRTHAIFLLSRSLALPDAESLPP